MGNWESRSGGCVEQRLQRAHARGQIENFWFWSAPSGPAGLPPYRGIGRGEEPCARAPRYSRARGMRAHATRKIGCTVRYRESERYPIESWSK